MTQLSQSRCPNCGGELYAINEEQLQCLYCASKFENNAFQKRIATLQEFLDQTKIETVNNQRRNLYDAVCARYISKNEVHQYATEIKKLLPDDFQANFYLEALSGDVKRINALIREINVDDNYELLQPIIYFLSTSLQSEFLLELNLLVERAYKKRDPALYSRYATKISEEAEKVFSGVYETFLPRDVFIAYSSKDMDTVSRLCEDLEEQGFSCFVAARNLRHGVGSVENYDDALKEAMDNCTCFLFISSEHSRKFDCDAVRKEIPYIRSVDSHNAPAEFRNNYRMIPSKYKKPRIEYRLDMAKSATDKITDIFFDGYEWVYDTDGVIERLAQILYELPDSDVQNDSAPVSSAPKTAPVITPAPEMIPAPEKPPVCNHVEVIDPAIEPTCTEPGRTEGSHCELCGEILRQSVTIPARGHEFGAWTVTEKPTCTKEGKQERVCHCGEKETEILPSLGGHQPGEWETVKEATAQETGLKVKKCTVCGEHTAEEKIPKKQAPKAPQKTVSEKAISKKNETAAQTKESKNPTPSSTAPNAVKEQPEKKTVASAPVNQKEAKPADQPKKAVAPTARKESQGLAYKANAVSKTCSVTGQGTNADHDIVIPEKINGYRVTRIALRAFSGCAELANAVIPDSVKEIGLDAFENCKNLTSVHIPDSVKEIGGGAFSGCEGLTSVIIPKGVKKISESTFFGCKSLSSVSIPDSVTSIDRYAFFGCKKLASLTIPGDVTEIGDYAFSVCKNLTSVVIPDSVAEIGNRAFSGCKRLERVVIPDSVESIGADAFKNCPSLLSIQYQGKQEDWKMLKLDNSLKEDSAVRTVECTDGIINF